MNQDTSVRAVRRTQSSFRVVVEARVALRCRGVFHNYHNLIYQFLSASLESIIVLHLSYARLPPRLAITHPMSTQVNPRPTPVE